MPLAAMSWFVVTESQLPDRALMMPDTRQFDADHAQGGIVELRRLDAHGQVADMRPVLLAVAAIERRIVRLRDIRVLTCGNCSRRACCPRSTTRCSCR